MDYYTGVILVACVSDVLMLILSAGNTGVSRKEKRAIRTVFGMLLMVAVLEWACQRMDGMDLRIMPLHALVKCAELCLAPVIVTRWILLFTHKPGVRRLLQAICGLNIVFEVVSLFTPFIFTLGPDNVYRHGSFYNLYVACHALCILIFAVEAIAFSKLFQHRGRSQILAIVFFELFGLSFHLLWPQLRMDWLCTTMAFTFFYIYYINLNEQIDVLTRLLTRRSYEATVSSMQRDVTLVCFDVDDFKSVNDEYGHAIGDVCLQTVAKVILEVYGKYGFCYRLGGDEFCVILTRHSVDTQSVTRRFIDAMEEARARETRFVLPFVSVGYARHAHGESSIEEALKNADAMMYREKQKNKQLRSSGTA